ncbi:MAG: hypothetical protein PHI98_16595 [Eubacteriales bacterium]|nr:hypothetical protein [Eubacteriales bacterium]
MTRRQEIDQEVQRLIKKLLPSCNALFELPSLVYAQIMKDNVTRKQPYRVSFNHIESIMHQMSSAGLI